MTTPATPPLHPELARAHDLVYAPNGLAFTEIVAERESADYGGHALRIGAYACRFRLGKTTPTKAGQFVTLWLRSEDGPIRPFDTLDELDFVVVAVRSPAGEGQFVFPRQEMLSHGIMSRGGHGGKRAFRVYPPWVTPESDQAQRTQRWQAEHFLSVIPGTPADHGRVRELYRLDERRH